MRLIVVAAMMLAPVSARAMCGTPRWLGTDPTTLPPRGVLYVYQPEGAPRLRWVDAAGSAHVVQVSETVARIDYDAERATSLTVELSESTWTYRFDRSWRAPVAAPRVVDAAHYVLPYSCPSADSAQLRLDQPTAAVRVRWTFRGTTRTWIVPANDRTVEVGKLACAETTIDPAELAAGGTLELIAIRNDGSEVRIEGVARPFTTKLLRSEGDTVIAPPAPTLPVLELPDDDTPLPRALAIGLLLALAALSRAVLPRR